MLILQCKQKTNLVYKKESINMRDIKRLKKFEFYNQEFRFSKFIIAYDEENARKIFNKKYSWSNLDFEFKGEVK